MKRFFIVLTMAFLAMTVSTKSTYAQMVNPKFSVEGLPAEPAEEDAATLSAALVSLSKYDFNLPGLELDSFEDLPKLPNFEALTTQPEKGSLKSLYNRIQNDLKILASNAEIKINALLGSRPVKQSGNYLWGIPKDSEESQQTNDNKVKAAFVAWLHTIDECEDLIQDVSEDFKPGTFDNYLKALEKCRNDTLLVMSRSCFETLSKCLTDLEDKDPDWKTIADSLEGLLQIKSTIHQTSIFNGYEEKLETFRIQLKYQVKRNRMTDKNLQNRLEQLFDRCEKEITAQKEASLQADAKVQDGLLYESAPVEKIAPEELFPDQEFVPEETFNFDGNEEK